MRAGDLISRLIRVVDAAGNGVTGLAVSDFTIVSYSKGYASSIYATYTHGTTRQALGDGWYDITYAMPPSAGMAYYRIRPNSSSYRIETPNEWSGEVEVQDLDSMYGAVVRPVAQLTQTAQLGMALPFQFIAYRYRTIDITVVDQDGEEITTLETDFPASTLRLGIRSTDQVTTRWEAGPSAAISIPASGGGTAADFAISISGAVLSFTMPEDASWFAALALGATEINSLWLEITGDRDGDAEKTQPIIRSSQIFLTRREVGAPAA